MEIHLSYWTNIEVMMIQIFELNFECYYCSLVKQDSLDKQIWWWSCYQLKTENIRFEPEWDKYILSYIIEYFILCTIRIIFQKYFDVSK